MTKSDTWREYPQNQLDGERTFDSAFRHSKCIYRLATSRNSTLATKFDPTDRKGSILAKKPIGNATPDHDYPHFLGTIASVVEQARHSVAQKINATLTATYWLIGQRIIEYEQSGHARADYGSELLKRLSRDLEKRFGRGFSVDNLESMRVFYLAYPATGISETPSRISGTTALAGAFPLSWSHYVILVRRAHSQNARGFYESATLRDGWSVRQLRRQIDSQFYERSVLSRSADSRTDADQAAFSNEPVAPLDEIKDPYVLEFLDLKDDYTENDLEEGLIRHLETFLLELESEFCFVSRQKRLRIGTTWYRVDLVFFHRRLRCLVVIDLKIGAFTHADAGQMHLYLNYAREHWRHEDENPPVGLILCTHRDNAVAHYALEGLPNKVMAAEYRTVLPDEEELTAAIAKSRANLEERKSRHSK
jgi:predicted nuclease of restriction endonuclease-like (RecB) superfamily